MWYTYVLKSMTDKNLYTGCSKDLKSRFKMHQEGKIESTKDRGPFILLYYEACRFKNDAFNRERYLKSGYGKRFLKIRLKEEYNLAR